MKKFELNVFLTIALIVLFSVSAEAASFILGTPATQPTTVMQSTVSATPSTVFTFTRSLILGMTGQDVSALNKILDLEFNTTIANPGTYTATTQNYVSELQMRYASTILTPEGLTNGTGTAGPATRVKLNALAQEYNLTVADFPAPAASTNPQIFTQTLSLGTVSSQVSLLKTVLNSDPTTQIVYANASQQSASNVFDVPTQIAVNKFQQKYASIILIPNGLSSPTGIVGAATRAKLNQLLANVTASGINTTPVATTTITTPANTNYNNIITSSCTTDTWSCGNWGPCSHAGSQTRTCQITYACQNPGANHVDPDATTQSCTPLPYCPYSAPQSYSYTYDLDFNGGRQGGVQFNLSGYKTAYAPGETVTLSAYVGITDGGPFSMDQMNMNIDGGPDLIHAVDTGHYASSNIITNGSGSQNFTVPTTPGNYSMSVSYWLSDVYDGGEGSPINIVGPKVLSISQTVHTDNIPYTVVDPNTCDTSNL